MTYETIRSVTAFKALILVLSTVFLSVALIAAEAEPALDYELIKPDYLFIGIPFNLEVLITSHQDSDVHHPVRDTVGIFAILNIDKETYRDSDERYQLDEEEKLTKISYTLAGFDTGKQRIPPLHFEIYPDEDEKPAVLSTPSLTVTIGSVLPDTIDTIKDIAPPFRLRLGFWDIVIPLIIILLIALMIYLLIRKMKKPLVEEIEEIEQDTRPDYVKALELLDNLKKMNLLEKGEFIEFYYRISLILRLFIEMHYGFKAVEMTTGEIERYVKAHFTEDDKAAVPHEGKQRFIQYSEVFSLLRYADLVKFAKFSPEMKRSKDFIEWLESYFNSFSKSDTPGSRPDNDNQ